MATIVVYGGGFQPFHEGHLSSYLQAKKAFPDATFYVAASNDVKQRPIPFKDKQFLAQQAGVVDPFVETKNPINPQEILAQYNPEQDVYIMVRSERDPVSYTRKDGSPAYYQPYVPGEPLAPFGQHGYVFVSKKHTFTVNGEEVYSGSQVRSMYGSADDAGRMKIIQQLYPKSKQQPMIKKLLDKYLASPQEPAVVPTKTTAMSKLKNKALAEQISKIRPLIKEASPAMKLKFMRLMKTAINESKVTELSPQTLASYKKKAGADATASDKVGDTKRADKRFSGIVKATKKEFDNDSKGVAEAFDQPYATKWEKSDYGDVDLLAKLPDGTPLSIMFNKQQDNDGEEIIQVEFYRNNSQEVTGEGDAQRVFATVLTAIQKYIKKYNPARLSFSASKHVDQGQNSESRAKLYDRLVQRYAKAWGYRAFRADNGDLVIYELSRRDPVAETSDDPWGPQGNFAGDTPVNIGGDTVKQLGVGDVVSYLGQKAKILAQSKPERKYSRIQITKGMGSVTQDVLTSDLKRTGGSIEEGISLHDIAWVGNLVPSFMQRIASAGTREAKQTAMLGKILGKWVGTGELTPAEEAFAKQQLIDIAKMIAGLAVASAVTASAPAHAAASALASNITHIAQHGAVDLGLDALAVMLSKNFKFDFLKKIMHSLETDSGKAFSHVEKKQFQAPEDDIDKQVNQQFQKAKMGFGGMSESTGLSIEQLAHISDKALDDAYHYGRSTPGANFGWLANLQSAKAAKRLIDMGETDIEKISDAIHKGWNVTAAADYKGQLQLDTPTPDEKKLKRAKLAQQSYSQLPEEEKEKDRVVARAMLAALGKTNVSESKDYLEEK
jgi:hypothetical protein